MLCLDFANVLNLTQTIIDYTYTRKNDSVSNGKRETFFLWLQKILLFTQK